MSPREPTFTEIAADVSRDVVAGNPSSMQMREDFELEVAYGTGFRVTFLLGRRPRGARTEARVRSYLDGTTPCGTDPGRWWTMVGSTYFDAYLDVDGVEGACKAKGHLTKPYLQVNDLDTDERCRRRGLATSLLNTLRDRLGLQPVPEIVRAGGEGAIEFWTAYLPDDLAAVSGGTDEGWSTFFVRLRKLRRDDPERWRRVLSVQGVHAPAPRSPVRRTWPG